MITTKPHKAGTRSPEEIDADLAEVLYTERREELTSFFFRRTQNGEITATLLAQTFATAAQIRMKRSDKSEHDHDWITGIATLELSRYFRAGSVSTKAITTIELDVPELSSTELARLEEEVQTEANLRKHQISANELVLS